jgi:S-adenosylmethionine decarboxylase
MPETVFEGPEKKVELVVQADFPSLRSFGKAAWLRVVHAAGAHAISVSHDERCDAFLLSESSLFVFDDYMVMITCGQTTLVEAVVEMLRFVPPEAVAMLVYERKNEHFPKQQTTTFEQDVERLRAWVPGQAFVLGEGQVHSVQMFCSSRPFEPPNDEPTLEVLMHDIADDVASRFQGAVSERYTECLATLLPGFATHEHAFSPGGYSVNALRGESYYTVHVTPENACSYVSFETNHDFRDGLQPLVTGVVSLFGPSTFDVITFLPEGPTSLSVDGYDLGDSETRAISGYCVSYLHYQQQLAS